MLYCSSRATGQGRSSVLRDVRLLRKDTVQYPASATCRQCNSLT